MVVSSPGHIMTQGEIKNHDNLQATSDWVNNNYPLRRYGSPDDVAKVILFLASDGAAFITGSNIPVDSGYLTLMPGPNVYKVSE